MSSNPQQKPTNSTPANNNNNNKKDSSHDDYDMIIIGAGLSGINAAHHFRQNFPQASFQIIEARDQIGGTWDLFQYPGLRSDSDKWTFGYVWREWNPATTPRDKILVDKEDILQYLEETLDEQGLRQHVEFGIHIQKASWDSVKARWTLSGIHKKSQQPVKFQCTYLFVCAGYYSYEQGYTPAFQNIHDYQGQLIHPQEWPRDFDYSNKKMVVIGSGATAITLLPALLRGENAAAHVTMVQRSPSYLIANPRFVQSWLGKLMLKILPSKVFHLGMRFLYAWNYSFDFFLCRYFPTIGNGWILFRTKWILGKDLFAAKQHDFIPYYNMWDQRPCVCPDGDFLECIKDGRADIVTDQIVKFTKTGLQLQSAGKLDADVIVTATGLNVQMAGGIDYQVDGSSVQIHDKYAYKGCMLQGVPNLFFTLGYVNASFTLKTELVCRYVCRRLLPYLDKNNYRYCQPQLRQDQFGRLKQYPLMDLTANYLQRVASQMPHSSTTAPWTTYNYYWCDKWMLQYAALKDNYMTFYK